IVVEPVLGEGGVVVPPPGFLRGLGELARRHGVLVIADEVQTGLGRTGHWFASVAAGLDPDVITLAKPLGGGLVPVGATIARRDVYRSLLPSVASKRHSNTFGGGTLASAVALRSLEILVAERLDLRARELGVRGVARLLAVAERLALRARELAVRGLARMLPVAARYPDLVEQARGAGMLFAFKLRPLLGFKVPGIPAADVQAVAATLAIRVLQENGVHACYSANAERVVRFTPALNIPDPLFTELWDRVEAFAAANPRTLRLLQRFPLPRLMRLVKLAYG